MSGGKTRQVVIGREGRLSQKIFWTKREAHQLAAVIRPAHRHRWQGFFALPRFA